MGVRSLGAGMYEFDPQYDGDDNARDWERQEIKVRLSRLPLATRHTHRFASWNDEAGDPDAFAATLRLARGELDPPFLLLFGGPGLGKTHLAIAAGWARVLYGQTVAYHQTVEFLDALKDGFRVQQSLGPGEASPDTYHTVLNYAKSASLLILDDLGTQKDTEWAAERLDEVINHRYIERMATIVTTNTLEIPTRVMDRLKEGTVIRLKGASYRGRK